MYSGSRRSIGVFGGASGSGITSIIGDAVLLSGELVPGWGFRAVVYSIWTSRVESLGGCDA